MDNNEQRNAETEDRIKRYASAADWRAEGRRRFGPEQLKWRFVCPACGYVASTKEYKDAGAPDTAVAFSCVGRWSGARRLAFGKGSGPCDYAGGGLLRLNPVHVQEAGSVHQVFNFAEPTMESANEAD